MARPYIITISCEKGGVGKTTIATNLAVYLKALAEDLPVTLLSFDNHFTIDRMFNLANDNAEHHVGHLFTGVVPSTLVRQGQYGVKVIASCHNLGTFNPSPPRDEDLAGIFGNSDLNGVVIIDTCPILDPYTRNALYAADRVIVPIKDAPSLENCKHLAQFFTDHGIIRSPLRLLPCLIDTRIHFSGPFRNSYQLLKAYAINRGYRCLEGYIAKSPKVESLATNPEGKVYPILTHGRSTEAHLQFNHLARQIYLEYLEKGPSRVNDVAELRRSQEILSSQREQQRRQRLLGQCLCCGKQLDQDHLIEAFYVQTSELEICGLVELDCFYAMFFNDLYGDKSPANPATIELFRETAPHTYFQLQRYGTKAVKFSRLDKRGNLLSMRDREVKSNRGLFQRGTPMLHNLIELTLPVDQPSRLVLIRHTSLKGKTLFSEESYSRFQTILSKACLDAIPHEEVTESASNNPVFP